MAPGVAKSFVKELAKVLRARHPKSSLGDEILVEEASGKLTNEGIKEELKKYRKRHRLIMDERGYQFIRYLFTERYMEAVTDEEIELLIKMATAETEEATYQAMEAVIHNLNSMHSRAGAQVPFSSLNYGTDTSTEGRMVIKYILKATEDGLGNGETAIFPQMGACSGNTTWKTKRTSKYWV